jgi:hypothetical protein
VIPVADCIAATGTCVMVGCGGWGGGGGEVWGLKMIGVPWRTGGGDVTVNRQDLCEEVGGVDEGRKEDKTEKILTGPLLNPV